MIRTILIPTDFSIESLRLLKEALQVVQIGKVSIILFHCIRLPDSIMDLLFSSRLNQVKGLISDDFRDACTILSNKYAKRINALRIEIYSGETQRAFSNFIDANRVDEILIPKPFTLRSIHRDSFSPEPFIRKSNVIVTDVAWRTGDNVPEKNTLAEIFLL